MKIRMTISVLLLAMLLSLFAGCTVTAVAPAGEDAASAPEESLSVDTYIRFSGETVAITGSGAALDNGQIVISKAGVYEVSGTCGSSRLMVKAEDADDVTIILAGLDLTNPEDEAIYFKTCGSARVILKHGTENSLTSGFEGYIPEEITVSEDGRDEATGPSGAVLRALCPMTLEGSGSLTVTGYINNGIAADGGLTVTGGTYDIHAANDGLKSDGGITVTGGDFTVTADHDGISSGLTLEISGGSMDVTTGGGSASADMKISDSLFMGAGGGGMRNRNRGSSEASAEAEETAGNEAETATSSEITAEETTTETAESTGIESDTATASSEITAEETDTGSSEAAADDGTEDVSPSREMGMPGAMPGFDDWMDSYDADSLSSDSYKGLKSTGDMIISGGSITVDACDDAIHSDGNLTISGGDITVRSGDDGIRAETTLAISGGTIDVQYCYEGLEATAILISDGYTNIVATDDGMNAGSMGMMGGPGGMRGGSSEASSEVTGETDTERVESVVRISGGTVIVDSGGDSLDSNASMYIEGGLVLVNGPSTNWDSPIDYGEGSSVFVISGGFLMAAGYSGMFESPDITADTQSFIYYIQSDYAPDGAVTTLTASDGTVLAEYAFANSYNGVLISTPELAAGKTYTLTINGAATTIEMTSATYSNRGGSGEMGARR